MDNQIFAKQSVSYTLQSQLESKMFVLNTLQTIYRIIIIFEARPQRKPQIRNG